MSEFTRLETVLSKLRLRERAPGEGRKLQGTDAEAMLTSLVAEIDETILPRRLVFTTEKGVAFHFAVEDRRLQALLPPAPSLSGVADLVDHAIAGGEDPALTDMAAALREAFGEAQTVGIQSFSQPAGVFDADVGVRSGALTKAWNVQDAPERISDPSEILSSFLDQIDGDDATAWLRIEGEDVTDQAGEAEDLAALGEQAAVFLDSYFSKLEMLFGSDAHVTAIAISPGEQGENAALFVEIGGMSAFVSSKSARVAVLATKWQALVAE